jgi:hypothetical protein
MGSGNLIEIRPHKSKGHPTLITFRFNKLTGLNQDHPPIMLLP